MPYKTESLEKYLKDLSEKIPAPGGGSAAALNAALGASLISMVVNFTLGKPKFAQHEEKLKEIHRRSEKLRHEFLDLVDKDVEAYNSKDLRQALNIPFMLCRLCYEAIKLCPVLIKIGNPNLISDVAVAAVMIESAFTAGYFNVDINLKALQDKKLAKGIRKELSRKQALIKKMRLKTEEKIGKIIRG